MRLIDCSCDVVFILSCVCLFVRLFVCGSVCLCACLFVCVLACLLVGLLARLLACLFVGVVCLCAFLCVCLSAYVVCLFACLLVWLSRSSSMDKLNLASAIHRVCAVLPVLRTRVLSLKTIVARPSAGCTQECTTKA